MPVYVGVPSTNGTTEPIFSVSSRCRTSVRSGAMARMCSMAVLSKAISTSVPVMVFCRDDDSDDDESWLQNPARGYRSQLGSSEGVEY